MISSPIYSTPYVNEEDDSSNNIENNALNFDDINNKIIHESNFQKIDSKKEVPKEILDPNKQMTSSSSLNNKKKSEEKIFYIIKIKPKNKRGLKPKKKNSTRNHIRNSKDNIITKILVYFSNSSIKTINLRIKKNMKKELKKVKPFFKKEKYEPLYNYFMNKTFGEMLSKEISDKYKTEKNKKYNAEIIKKIYEENKDEELIELLNKKIEIIYKIYIGEINEEKYNDFFNLKKDINELAKKDKIYDEKYYNRYKMEADKLLYTLSKYK